MAKPDSFRAETLPVLAQCTWRVAEANPKADLEKAARLALHWAVLRRHQGIMASVEELRKKFLDGWNLGWGDKARTGEKYWTGPQAARAFGRRVYLLLNRHEVYRPYEPYTLGLGQQQVTGELAILVRMRSRMESVATVLHAPLRRPRDLRVPDYGALADWLAARQVVDGVDLYLLHQPLISGESWMDKDINERLTRTWLTRLLENSENDIPRPGSWCTDCSHPCRRIYDGPDDYRR